MKKFSLLLVLFLSLSLPAQASVRQFIKTCGWGVVMGATAGLASLALVDRPEDNLANIAKGASLGLYAGIAYGVYQHNEEKRQQQAGALVIAPRMHDHKLEGVQISSTVWEF